MGGIRPLFVAFILLFHYILEGGGGDYPQRVTGLIGETSDLVFLQNFTHCAKEIVFKFNRGSETFKIAEFKDKKLKTVLPQFQNRLELLRDVMGLRIKNVSFNDSGMYIAKITLENNTEHTVSFNLSLYEPVPAPSLTIDNENYTSDKCHFTLNCVVRGNTASLSYTWKYRHNSSDNFKLYNSTGATIQISLQPGSSDIEVLCTVRNPADQKNVSCTLKSCRKETHEPWWIIALAALVLVLLLGAVIIIWCNKEKIRAAFQTRCKEELKLSVPETNIFVDLDHVPFPVSESAVKYSKCFYSVHEKKDDKIELGDSEHVSFLLDPGDSEHPSILPDPGDSEHPSILPDPGDSEHPSILPDPGDSEHPSILPDPGDSEHPSFLPDPGDSEHRSFLPDPGDSEHASILPDPGDSENEEEC